MDDVFDVVVAGGGHAGVEAVLAAARVGVRACLVTQQVDAVGRLSCNPSIGGIGKSHLVREIDALGGLMGIAADATAIQYRTLNTQKGPAVQATRVQCDRRLYNRFVRDFVLASPGVTVIQGEAVDVIEKDGAAVGLRLSDGREVHSLAVVLSCGTFLDGLLHFGQEKVPGGRVGEPPSHGLSDRLRRLGLSVGRLKTGTPPRLLADSLDFSRMEIQESEDSAIFLSARTVDSPLPKIPCHITWTTSAAHDAIRQNLHRAPLFSGQIRGRGPRYCPSIEDKIVRFAHHDRHQVFVEPEGLDSPEVYPAGLATSLPRDVQDRFIHQIAGFESAVISQPGYAVEYDFVDPRECRPSLQVRDVPGLFLAGQVLGTTGYEEAGALGLLAGANAALSILGKEPLVPSRSRAYMGVMVDDLTTRGVTEPYRMFTSRAEFRLCLREDNAAERMMADGEKAGLLEQSHLEHMKIRAAKIAVGIAVMDSTRVKPGQATDDVPISSDGAVLSQLARRPGATWESIVGLDPTGNLAGLSPDEARAVMIRVRYEGYIAREQAEAERIQRHDSMRIPDDIDYRQMPGLSIELRDRLSATRPDTIGQASRLEGMTPAALAAILVRIR